MNKFVSHSELLDELDSLTVDEGCKSNSGRILDALTGVPAFQEVYQVRVRGAHSVHIDFETARYHIWIAVRPNGDLCVRRERITDGKRDCRIYPPHKWGFGSATTVVLRRALQEA